MEPQHTFSLTAADLGKMMAQAIATAQVPIKFRAYDDEILIPRGEIIETVFGGSRRRYDNEIEAGRLETIKLCDSPKGKVYVKNRDLKKYLKIHWPDAYKRIYTFEKLIL